MTITVTVTPATVVPSITAGATVTVAATGGVSNSSIGAAIGLTVANIDDPSIELAAVAGTLSKASLALCYQTVAGVDAWRLYALDNASSTAAATPFRIDRSAGGQWVLIGGKGTNSDFQVNGSLRLSDSDDSHALIFSPGNEVADRTISIPVLAGNVTLPLLEVAGSWTATQTFATVDINGGTIDGTAIGGSSASTGAFSTVSATGQITSTVATGSAPLVIASTTVVANLNVSQLLGSTWAIPAAIGSTTPAAGTFTTLIGNSVAVYDTGGDHTITIDTASNEAASRTLTIPPLGGNAIMAVSSSALTIARVTFAAANGLLADDAALTYGSGTLTIQTTVAALNLISTAGSANSSLTGTSGAYFDMQKSDATAARYYCGITESGGNFSVYDHTNSVYRLQISPAGVVSVIVATASTSTATGALVVAGGVGVAGNITFSGASGASLRLTTATANAAVATTLGSVGPTGSTAGDPQGWLRLSVAGTDRYIPFW